MVGEFEIKSAVSLFSSVLMADSEYSTSNDTSCVDSQGTQLILLSISLLFPHPHGISCPLEFACLLCGVFAWVSLLLTCNVCFSG